MKTRGGLYAAILERENLRTAFWKAAKGKRDRLAVRAFAGALEENLDALASAMRDGTAPANRFTTFTIRDPKERRISAPVLADRVVHHAILNVCEADFERTLVDDTYACRVGKGQFAAIARARTFAARHEWYLKLDVRKYFGSIPKETLCLRIDRLFREEPVRALFRSIVFGFAPDSPIGLPIGSLTSQHLANFYLGRADRFIKEELRVKAYVRYMDDMVLWSGNKATLRRWDERVRTLLADEMGLTLKPGSLHRTSRGMDYLGYRIHPTSATLNRRSKLRYRRKYTLIERLVEENRLSEFEAQQRLGSLVAFTLAGGTACTRFRRMVESQRDDAKRARTA